LEKPENIGTASIAPMIMLPFIENAFKHGVSAHEKSEIKITVAKNDNHLLLTVKNDIFNKQGMDLEAQSGIGLTNTRRRLELLYPGQHNLVINDDKETFEVSLDLTLI
jgi:LytS/YehU family sensor histidine kinase